MSQSPNLNIPPFIASASRYVHTNISTFLNTITTVINEPSPITIFGTLSVAPDASAFNIPVAVQGAPSDAEVQIGLTHMGMDVLARLSVAYFQSASASAPDVGFGLLKQDAVRSQLAELLGPIVEGINAELMMFEKGRGYRIHWEIIQNTDFRKRYGHLPGAKDQQFLGHWVRDEEALGWKTDIQFTNTLRSMVVVHLALTSDGRRGQVFVVPLGRDRESMERWMDGDFWETVAQRMWEGDTDGTAVTTATPAKMKEAFLGVWKERREAAGVPRATTLPFDADQFGRCLPKWDEPMRERIAALNNPGSDSKLSSGCALSGAGGERMIVSPILSQQGSARDEVPPPLYDDSTVTKEG